jgi:hypothetical protein
MPPKQPRSHDTVLLEIFERLGGIEADLKAQAGQHREMSIDLKEVKTKVEAFGIISEAVKRMRPIVDDYERNKNKAIGVLALIVVLSSGLGFIASQIKSWIFGAH